MAMGAVAMFLQLAMQAMMQCKQQVLCCCQCNGFCRCNATVISIALATTSGEAVGSHGEADLDPLELLSGPPVKRPRLREPRDRDNEGNEEWFFARVPNRRVGQRRPRRSDAEQPQNPRVEAHADDNVDKGPVLSEDFQDFDILDVYIGNDVADDADRSVDVDMAPANEGFDILDMFVDSGNDAAFDDVGQPRADAPADVDALETRSNASVEGSESDDEGADDPNDIEVPDGPDEADTPAEQALLRLVAEGIGTDDVADVADRNNKRKKAKGKGKGAGKDKGAGKNGTGESKGAGKNKSNADKGGKGKGGRGKRSGSSEG